MKRTRGDQGGRTMAKRSRAPAARLYRTPAKGSFKADKIHSFQRALMIHHNITDAPLQNNGAAFTLNSLPNYTEFTGLFDVYRIRKVVVTFICDRATASVGAAAVANTLTPNLWVCTDYDDATPLATEGDWSQVEGAKYKQLDRPVTWTVYPRVAAALYGGAFTSYGNTNMWVDLGSPGVQWYGIKWAYDMYSAAGAGATILSHINIHFNLTIECKGVR